MKLTKDMKQKRKRCSSCKILKSLDNFSPCKKGKFGLFTYCKKCNTARVKALHPNRKELDEKQALKSGLRKQGLKRCSSCHSIKSLEEYWDHPEHKDGKGSTCKDCYRQGYREYDLKRGYGISIEQYEQMMEAQKGCCAICKRASKKRNLAVDHDHENGFIRGLICDNCNRHILPKVEYYWDWVLSAKLYLISPPAFSVVGKLVVPETNKSKTNNFLKHRKIQSFTEQEFTKMEEFIDNNFTPEGKADFWSRLAISGKVLSEKTKKAD